MTYFHEHFVAFQRRHAAELDAWERATKKALHDLANFHRRGIGQSIRQRRNRLTNKETP